MITRVDNAIDTCAGNVVDSRVGNVTDIHVANVSDTCIGWGFLSFDLFHSHYRI